MPKKPRYTSLQDWMDRTGHNQDALVRLVNRRTTVTITAAALSMILRGSRRCSLKHAMALSLVTGVPVENLTEWPKLMHES